MFHFVLVNSFFEKSISVLKCILVKKIPTESLYMTRLRLFCSSYHHCSVFVHKIPRCSWTENQSSLFVPKHCRPTYPLCAGPVKWFESSSMPIHIQLEDHCYGTLFSECLTWTILNWGVPEIKRAKLFSSLDLSYFLLSYIYQKVALNLKLFFITFSSMRDFFWTKWH
jgi:hypothetical protein